MHSFLKEESLGETRSKKSWNQFKEYDSPSLRYDKASIREKKGPSLGKINVKALHQRSPYAMTFEDRFHEETERPKQSMEPRQKKYTTSKKKKTRLHSTFPWRNGYSRLRQQKSRRRGSFVVDSGASLHMVSKRDVNSAELETMRISRSPTTVMTANGEVQTREEATVHVKQLDSFVKVMLLEETPAVW